MNGIDDDERPRVRRSCSLRIVLVREVMPLAERLPPMPTDRGGKYPEADDIGGLRGFLPRYRNDCATIVTSKRSVPPDPRR